MHSRPTVAHVSAQPKKKARIIFPRDVSDWVLLFAPFLIAILAARRLGEAHLALSGVLFFFLVLRGPLVQWARSRFNTFPDNARPTVVLAVAHSIFLSVLVLFRHHLWQLLPLALAAAGLFAAFLWLAARRKDGAALGQLLTCLLLTASAPAAWYAARETFALQAWLLWGVSAILGFVGLLVARRGASRRLAQGGPSGQARD